MLSFQTLIFMLQTPLLGPKASFLGSTALILEFKIAFLWSKPSFLQSAGHMPGSLPAATAGIHIPLCPNTKFSPELVNSWVCCRYDPDDCATALHLLLCCYSAINGRPLKLSVGRLSSHPQAVPWWGRLKALQEDQGTGLGGWEVVSVPRGAGPRWAVPQQAGGVGHP